MAGVRSRRRSAELTRRKLLEVGRAAFAAHGHGGVNLQRDVLTPAGVSVGSFYHQFRDKTDLLVAILEEASELAQATVIGADSTASDPVERTCATFERFFALIDRGEEVVRIQMRERDNPDERIRSILARSRAAWVESWTAAFQHLAGDRGGFDPQAAAQMVMAVGLGSMLLYMDTPVEDRPSVRASLLDALVPFTLGGFVALGARRPR